MISPLEQYQQAASAQSAGETGKLLRAQCGKGTGVAEVRDEVCGLTTIATYGSVFPVRERLKQYGLLWDPVAGWWIGHMSLSDPRLKLIRELVAAQAREVGTGRRWKRCAVHGCRRRGDPLLCVGHFTEQEKAKEQGFPQEYWLQ